MKLLPDFRIAPFARNSTRCPKALAWAALFSLCITSSLVGEDTKNPLPAAKPMFDKVGPQLGEQLPELRLRTLKGEPQNLGNAWRGGPTLIVTSSFTCPKSRSRWPQLAAIEKRYGEKLNVVVLYVIEAHPVGSVCPYKGVEDVTPENRRDDILRKQPKTLEDRLDLAMEFKRYLRIDAPIYVDPLDNRAWKAFGAAPNIAFLVDERGFVAARQGWFDGPTLQKAIDAFLSKPKTSRGEAAEEDDDEREKKASDLEAELKKAGLESWDIRNAIREGETKKLAAILKAVPSVLRIVIGADQGHPHSLTLLMEAVEERNLRAVTMLLEAGADIKTRTTSYDSALQLAAEIGQPEMVKLLLGHKADPDFPATGRTPLHEALIGGHAGIAKILIEAGAHEDCFSNIGLGKIVAVRAALAADPSRASRPDGAGRMPLDYAAASSELKIAKLLLDCGAPIVDYDLSPMRVPLHYAIQKDNVEFVELLLKAGASPNTALGWRGESPTADPPLHMAIRGDHREIVKLLLAYKADLKNRDTYSQMPLHFAAVLGKAEFVELLLRAGADVKATTIRFDLPCGSGEEETPQYNTPLHFAAASGNPATIKALLAGGADIEARNVQGNTPLISALEPPIYTGINDACQLQNIELLLISGAKVNAENKHGRTALDIAREPARNYLANRSAAEQQKLHKAIIDLLTKHGGKAGKPKKAGKDGE